MTVGGLLCVSWFPSKMAAHAVNTSGWWLWLLLCVAAALASISGVGFEHHFNLKRLKKLNEQNEEELVVEGMRLLTEEREQNLATLEVLVGPLVYELPSLATSADKEADAATILNRLLGVFAQVISSDGLNVKANYYQLRGQAKGRYLRRADQTGMHARQEFKKTISDKEA